MRIKTSYPEDAFRKYSEQYIFHALQLICKYYLAFETFFHFQDKSYWIFKREIQLSFNPGVTFFSFFIITSVTLIMISFDLETAEFSWLDTIFTSLYVFPRTLAVFGLLSLLLSSKISSLKLSPDEDTEPEFSTPSWVCMILMTGLGIEFISDSVSYPIDHYTENNRYLKDNYMPDNTLAQNALNLMFYHWG